MSEDLDQARCHVRPDLSPPIESTEVTSCKQEVLESKQLRFKGWLNLFKSTKNSRCLQTDLGHQCPHAQRDFLSLYLNLDLPSIV